MEKNSVRVKAMETEQEIPPGDFVTFSYKSEFHAPDGTDFTAICELQFQNIDGVLVVRGPLNVVSITPGITTEPAPETKKQLEDIWH